MCVWGGGSSNRCIIACTHLGNGTGHRTVNMPPLLLNSDLVSYEAVLHSCGTSPVGSRVGTNL